MATPTKQVNGVLPKPTPNAEVGVSAHLPFVTPYRDMWEALRTEEITVKQLQAMRKSDGQARALYRLITLPIRAALKAATFVPEDQVEGGEDEAKFIEQMFTLPASGGGMTVPLGRVVAQLLMAIFDGFSAFEMVYWVPDTGPLKDKWTLKKMAYRPSDSVTFLLNDKSEYGGLRQRTMYMDRQIDVKIPGEHSFYYAANEEERPFYGQSYFTAAWYHWDKKFKLYVVAHLAAQRAAVGTRVGKLPKNPTLEDKNSFQRALADLGVAQWMTIPEDYAVDSLKETAGFDFLSLINHHNSQMSKSILAAFFDKEQGGGDSAKLVDFGTQSDSLFLLMLQTIMGEIEEVINAKVIPRFIDWNFDSGKYPKFQFGSLSEQQKNAMFDLLKTLGVAGQSLTVTPEFVHELEKQVSEELGLEMDWDSIEHDMEFQQQQQALQQEMDAHIQAGGAPAGPALPGDTAPTEAPQVPAKLLPAGFVLASADEPANAMLVQLAADLLGEAYDAVGLTRGRPTGGGPKFVRTAAGAKVYGVPIGTPITRDLAERTAARGVEGRPFGAGIRGPNGGDKDTGRQVLGGGPGARAQHLGGVAIQPRDSVQAAPKQVLGNPQAPGVQLLDYGDGTVAIRDANGNLSPRQRFEVDAFLKLGWAVAHKADSGAAKGTGTAAAK